MSLRNPVKYPVKYYSWQDAQAPQLTDADGVIKTILKACLVTGYGSKAGAGWTSLFEDAYRIVLRRPLRTGNPPDIKIENGTFAVNGSNVTRHRIVAQDNPTGLDDTTELSAVNLLARDSKKGSEWHCIVTDFAFLLCYQMGENGMTGDRNNLLFIGGCKKLLDSDAEYFITTSQQVITTNGTSGAWMYGILHQGYAPFYELRRKTSYTQKLFLDINVAEKYFNNDYLAQKIIIDKLIELPFFAAIPSQYDNLTTSQITINNRPMLRYVNKPVQNYSPRALYIPLDYWEL